MQDSRHADPEEFYVRQNRIGALDMVFQQETD